MNEKPQETRDDDFFERIISQGLEKMKTPAQTTAAEEAPGSETDPAPGPADSGETASPAEKKNKRSAVYLYLLILFGAAFLMLLLAYFIQQRNSETTISDLRDSMNLSREELLAQIRELEGQVANLRSEAKDWEARYNQARLELGQYQQENADLSTMYDDAMKYYVGWERFWALDQSYQAGDYESCAAILLMQAQGVSLIYRPSTDSAQERYREIRQAVVDKGILDEDYDQHPEKYSELLNAYLLQHDFIFSYSGRQEP